MACVAIAHADVALLPAARDNTMYEDFGGDLSNGSGPSFFAGKTLLESRRRGLIAFDLSGIPAGSTINTVTLTLHCTRSSSLAEDVSLRPALASWGEGTSVALGEGGSGTEAMENDATWHYRLYPAVVWAADGGDFGPASATTSVVADGAYDWTSALMTADVQSWVNTPAANFGWGVLGNEDLPQTAKRFASRENPEEALRPVLRVDYTPVPGVGTWVAVGVAAATGLRGRRVRGGRG